MRNTNRRAFPVLASYLTRCLTRYIRSHEYVSRTQMKINCRPARKHCRVKGEEMSVSAIVVAQLIYLLSLYSPSYHSRSNSLSLSLFSDSKITGHDEFGLLLSRIVIKGPSCITLHLIRIYCRDTKHVLQTWEIFVNFFNRYLFLSPY